MKKGEKIEQEVLVIDSFKYENYFFENPERYCIRMTDNKNDFTWITASKSAIDILPNKKYILKAILGDEKDSRDIDIRSYFVKNCKFKEKQ